MASVMRVAEGIGRAMRDPVAVFLFGDQSDGTRAKSRAEQVIESRGCTALEFLSEWWSLFTSDSVEFRLAGVLDHLQASSFIRAGARKMRP